MSRHSTKLAIVSLMLLPLLWLWPCVFGGRTFVPYDVAQFPPVSITATPEQVAEARADANFDVTEPPVWFVPELELARDELRHGRLPTWNPNARGGAPLHAHGLIGLLYPPNWLLLNADDPAGRLVFVAWINLALGGLLAFGLLRRLGITTLAAWFGALLFQLSGPMASNAFFWMRLASFLWLPGVCWAALVVAESERLRPRQVLALAGAFAMTWLAGFPPFAMTTTLLAGAFACWLVVRTAQQHGARPARTMLLRLGCGFLLGAGVAMPQVLPSMLFFPQSARPTAPKLTDITGSAFESYGLLGYVLPDAISHPSKVADLPYTQVPLALLLNTRSLENGNPALPNYNYTEYAVFIGTFGLLLAIVGALLGRGRHRGFVIAAFVSCLGLALYVPVVNLLFRLPIVENVWPMRWLAPATLLLAWLAALGCERLLAGTRRLPIVLSVAAASVALLLLFVTDLPRKWHAADRTWSVQRLADKYHTASLQNVVDYVQPGAAEGYDRFALSFAQLADEGQRAAWWWFGAAVLFAAVAAMRSERRPWLLLTAAATTALQLGLHGATVTRGATRSLPVDTPVHTFLRERAAALADQGGFMIARGGIEVEPQKQLPPGQLMVPGIRDLQFYSHFDGRSLQPVQALLQKQLGERIAAKGYLTSVLPDTLPPASVENDFKSGAVPRDSYPTEHPFESPLLDLLGVRYVLATTALAHAGVRVGPELRGDGEFFVYERSTALPRAFAVDRVVPCNHDDDVVEALIAPQLQPRAAAFALAADLPKPLPAGAGNGAGGTRNVRFDRDDATHIELSLSAGPSPWLVLTDTWLPGWTATIDGEPAPIVRGNHSQRLLHVPTAACRVTFRYRCPGLAAGFWLLSGATLAWLLWAFATRHRNTGS